MAVFLVRIMTMAMRLARATAAVSHIVTVPVPVSVSVARPTAATAVTMGVTQRDNAHQIDEQSGNGYGLTT